MVHSLLSLSCFTPQSAFEIHPGGVQQNLDLFYYPVVLHCTDSPLEGLWSSFQRLLMTNKATVNIDMRGFV